MRHDLVIALTALSWGGAGAVLAWLLTWRLSRRSQPGALVSVCVVATASTVCAVIGNTRAMFLSMADEYITIAVAVLAGLLASLTAIVTARRFARDAASLHAAMGALGTGAVPVADGRRLSRELQRLRAELSSAGQVLAASREREQALESSRRQLMTWVSQDLRTPLAGLQAMVTALERGIAEPSERYHEQLRIEVDRLVGMADDLFELSQVHTGPLAGASTGARTRALSDRSALSGRSDRVNLDELVTACVATVEPVATLLGVQVIRQHDGVGPHSREVPGDSVELSRALTTLLINAIRHCAGAVTVAVAVSAVQDDGVQAVAVSVRDQCGGCPATPGSVLSVAGADRIVTDLTVSAAGIDEELAVTHGIITAHRGSIAVGNTGAGCEFTVRLPAYS